MLAMKEKLFERVWRARLESWQSYKRLQAQLANKCLIEDYRKS